MNELTKQIGNLQPEIIFVLFMTRIRPNRCRRILFIKQGLEQKESLLIIKEVFYCG